MRRLLAGWLVACATAFVVAACGAPPVTPTPTPTPGGNGGNGGPGNPPANNPPAIQSIAIQGTRAKEPANFADLSEAVAVSAKVTDDETAVDQLQYVWTATAGTFTGTGPNVTWQAPAQAPVAATGATPIDVTITLTVVEKYGNPGGPLAFEQSVSKTAPVSLHDSVKEVGTMARQFLLDFSDTNIKDADLIMRNFGGATCPDLRDVQAERGDVINNFTNYRMLKFDIGQPAVTINFGGACAFRGRKGDACATVPVFWDSVEVHTNVRTPNAGDDIISAAYSPKDSRWFLCASDYDGRNLLTGARISR